MYRYIFLIFFALSHLCIGAQQVAQNPYVYPLQGVARLYSGSFGEFRGGHFHSGVDIKTDGVEGKRVVAVADGYISRVGYSSSGFGLALYVTHPNGTTSVYAHLSRFREDVNNRVREERYNQQKHAITLFLGRDEYPVKQGEVIAYSGNSGSSAGPHLHFEIRDSRSQRPQNVFAKGYITPRDTRRPIIYKLYYVEVDTLDGVPHKSARRTYTTKNVALGQYTLSVPNNQISVGRNGYFIIEAVDRKDNVTNSFGLYEVEGRLDDTTFFKYRMDGFSFADTRYVNAVSDYAVSLISPREVLRLSQIECGTNQFYEQLRDGGVVSREAGQRGVVKIFVRDDVGLEAVLRFGVVGAERSFAAKVDSAAQIVRADRQFVYKGQGVRVTIPAKALYESMPFACEESSVELKDTSIMALSLAYKILDRETPIHRPIEIAIEADVMLDNQPHVALALLGENGTASYAGGGYRASAVVGSTRSSGVYAAVMDRVPPVVLPRFVDGADLTTHSTISFNIKDNFSGIKSYNAYIDGKWVALEYRAGRITHIFVTPPTRSEHTIRVEIEDNCGNSSWLERKFKR